MSPRAAIVLVVTVLVLNACEAASPSATPTLAPAPSPVVAGGAGGAAGGAGGGGGGGAGGAGAGAGAGSAAPSNAPTPEAFELYQVKQTLHLGDETVSGGACLPPGSASAQRFTVLMTTRSVTFHIGFTPTATAAGNLAHQYAFPSLGETHRATGTYAIASPAADGSRTVTLRVRDHVVFNGFDGVMPTNYTFALVPVSGACP